MPRRRAGASSVWRGRATSSRTGTSSTSASTCDLSAGLLEPARGERREPEGGEEDEPDAERPKQPFALEARAEVVLGHRRAGGRGQRLARQRVERRGGARGRD